MLQFPDGTRIRRTKVAPSMHVFVSAGSIAAAKIVVLQKENDKSLMPKCLDERTAKRQHFQKLFFLLSLVRLLGHEHFVAILQRDDDF